MTRSPPLLVYTKYVNDIPRFQSLLTSALPEAQMWFCGNEDEAAPYLDQTEILYGWGFSSAMLGKMPKLRWVQKMGAGVDDVIDVLPRNQNIILTRTDGCLIAPRMCEYVIAAILRRTQQLDHAHSLQAQRQWCFFEIGSIKQLTIGVAGLGEIGSEIARTLGKLGAQLVGWRKTQAPSDAVSKTFHGTEAFGEFVSECDVIVSVLPLTSDTKGIFNSAVFGAFKPDAHFINVGRGALVDELALLAALDSGRVGQATLDVFEREPLPPDHPFWARNGVTVTPHICGPLIPEDVAPHFIENYRSFCSGQKLRNIVDCGRQY